MSDKAVADEQFEYLAYTYICAPHHHHYSPKKTIM